MRSFEYPRTRNIGVDGPCKSGAGGNPFGMTENTSGPSGSSEKPDETVLPGPDQDALDRAKKKVAELDEIYEPGARPSVVVPGTDGTIAGTAFADMVDEQITENKPPEDLRNDDDS